MNEQTVSQGVVAQVQSLKHRVFINVHLYKRQLCLKGWWAGACHPRLSLPFPHTNALWCHGCSLPPSIMLITCLLLLPTPHLPITVAVHFVLWFILLFPFRCVSHRHLLNSHEPRVPRTFHSAPPPVASHNSYFLVATLSSDWLTFNNCLLCFD